MQNITKRQAQAALRAIETQFSSYLQAGYGPALVQNWDHYSWVIIWEDGAPYDWTMLAFHGGVDEEMTALLADAGIEGTVARVPEVKAPAGVWSEPVNNCVLALFPR